MSEPSLLMVFVALSLARADAPVAPVKPRCAFGYGGFSYTDTEYAFTKDGRWIAVGGDNTLLIRDARTGKELVDMGDVTGGRSSIGALAFSPDDKVLAVGHEDAIRLWDVKTQKWTAIYTGHTRKVHSLSFSRDGKWLASGSGDRTIRVWDRTTGKERFAITAHKGWVFAVAFSPDGKWLASAGGDEHVVLWDPRTGKRLRTLSGHTNTVDRLIFSGDGKMLASMSRDGTTVFHEMPSGKELRTLYGAVGVFSGDSKHWIKVKKSSIEVWDIATGKKKWARKPAKAWWPVSAVMSPDGRTLAVRCDSEQIYLWDVSAWLVGKK